ncbi:UNKNOWN [Stylonychia lemnae]|uniref:CRC domain-containing protein n=1 Tax=Stylonychia lemnae TaxID=5949 RepID=A0A078A518_STYLE|nr:UNKNOWN [Stylonychia lemnae]|eukprot:CDW76670.1 UNKNOWN [Stylonychia lemnae]
MGLKLNVDPFINQQNTIVFNKTSQTYQNQESSRDLPKLVSPKPQRPIPQCFGQLQRSISNNSLSQLQRNLTMEYPSFTTTNSNSFLSFSRQSSYGFQTRTQDYERQHTNDELESRSGVFDMPLRPIALSNQHQSSQQSSQVTISSNVSAFTKNLNSLVKQTAEKQQLQQYNQQPQVKSQIIQNKTSINNKNINGSVISSSSSFKTLPECLSQLLIQATNQIKNQKEKDAEGKILGKRYRSKADYDQYSFNNNGELSYDNEVSNTNNQSNSANNNYNNNQNFDNQVLNNLDKPQKRRHISSLSKAILAKKILNKIETENDPNANVIPKNQDQIMKEDVQDNSTDINQVEEKDNASKMPESLSIVPDSSAKACNCKRSKCLKLYCECFANNKFCGANCSCNGCSNHAEHDEERLQAKEQILMRNPLAFRPKIETSLDENSLFNKDIKIDKINIQEQSDVLLSVSTKPITFGILAVSDKEKRHFKGCNCKKSFCQKKYCECFQSGVNCTDLCKCDECKNNETCKPCTYEMMFKVQKEVIKPEVQILQTRQYEKVIEYNVKSIEGDPFQDISQNVFSIQKNNHNTTPKKEAGVKNEKQSNKKLINEQDDFKQRAKGQKSKASSYNQENNPPYATESREYTINHNSRY